MNYRIRSLYPYLIFAIVGLFQLSFSYVFFPEIHLSGDESTQLVAAKNLINGEGLSRYTGFTEQHISTERTLLNQWAPAYALFCALCKKIGLSLLSGSFLFKLIWYAVTCLIWIRVIRRLKLSRLAEITLYLYISLVSCSMLDNNTDIICMFYVGLLILTLGDENQQACNLKHLLALSAVLAMGVFFRFQLVIVPLAAILFLVFISLRERKWFDAVRNTIIIAVPAGIIYELQSILLRIKSDSHWQQTGNVSIMLPSHLLERTVEQVFNPFNFSKNLAKMTMSGVSGYEIFGGYLILVMISALAITALIKSRRKHPKMLLIWLAFILANFVMLFYISIKVEPPTPDNEFYFSYLNYRYYRAILPITVLFLLLYSARFKKLHIALCSAVLLCTVAGFAKIAYLNNNKNKVAANFQPALEQIKQIYATSQYPTLFLYTNIDYNYGTFKAVSLQTNYLIAKVSDNQVIADVFNGRIATSEPLNVISLMPSSESDKIAENILHAPSTFTVNGWTVFYSSPNLSSQSN